MGTGALGMDAMPWWHLEAGGGQRPTHASQRRRGARHTGDVSGRAACAHDCAGRGPLGDAGLRGVAASERPETGSKAPRSARGDEVGPRACRRPAAGEPVSPRASRPKETSGARPARTRHARHAFGSPEGPPYNRLPASAFQRGTAPLGNRRRFPVADHSTRRSTAGPVRLRPVTADPPKRFARRREGPAYVPYFSIIPFLSRPRIPYFAPTLLNASSAPFNIGMSWSADICVRIRACPAATTGKKNPMT